MFRFAFLAMALIGLGAVLAGGTGTIGTGLLLLAPLFFVGKILLVIFLFGALRGFLWGGYDREPWRPPWTRRRSRQKQPKEKSEAEQFEEWHRTAHAREEVDSWVEDFD